VYHTGAACFCSAVPNALAPNTRSSLSPATSDDTRSLTLPILQKLWLLLFLWSLWECVALPQIHREPYRRVLYIRVIYRRSRKPLIRNDNPAIHLPKYHTLPTEVSHDPRPRGRFSWIPGSTKVSHPRRPQVPLTHRGSSGTRPAEALAHTGGRKVRRTLTQRYDDVALTCVRKATSERAPGADGPGRSFCRGASGPSLWVRAKGC
jgi:hypothetical protein